MMASNIRRRGGERTLQEALKYSLSYLQGGKQVYGNFQKEKDGVVGSKLYLAVLSTQNGALY